MRKVYSFCKECGNELCHIVVGNGNENIFGCPVCDMEKTKEQEITMIEDEDGRRWIEVSK